MSFVNKDNKYFNTILDIIQKCNFIIINIKINKFELQSYLTLFDNKVTVKLCIDKLIIKIII